MKHPKDVVLFSLVVINIVIGSMNLYLNINTDRIVDNEIEEPAFSTDAMMLYFYDPSCDNCSETTEMIETYVKFGYDQFIDIEFIDVTYDHSSILKKYQIEDHQITNVPAIVLLDKGKAIDNVSGIDKIFELLDTIVSMTKTI